MRKKEINLYIVVTRIFIGHKLIRYKLKSIEGRTVYLEIDDFDRAADTILNVKKVNNQFVGVGINLTDIPTMAKLKDGTIKKSGKTEEYVKECAKPLIAKRLEEDAKKEVEKNKAKRKISLLENHKRVEGKNYLALCNFYSSYYLEMSEHSSSVMDLVDETLVSGKLEYAFSEIQSSSLRDGIRGLREAYITIKPLNVVDVNNIRSNKDKYFNELVSEFKKGNDSALQNLSKKYSVTIEDLKEKVWGFWNYR